MNSDSSKSVGSTEVIRPYPPQKSNGKLPVLLLSILLFIVLLTIYCTGIVPTSYLIQRLVELQNGNSKCKQVSTLILVSYIANTICLPNGKVMIKGFLQKPFLKEDIFFIEAASSTLVAP